MRKNAHLSSLFCVRSAARAFVVVIVVVAVVVNHEGQFKKKSVPDIVHAT